MMRQSITRCSRQLIRPARLFSTSVRTMAEGDLGAPAGGRRCVMRQAAKRWKLTSFFSDAFSKREKGQEDQYVRQQEMQKYVLKYDIV